MAAFSRLQLAAALLEYDNDPESPELNRSAQDSAIFAPLRRSHGPRTKAARPVADHMRVPLPSETGSLSGRMSAVGSRKSRASIKALQGMFGTEAEYDFYEDEEEEKEDNVEVDLSSWGLDAFMPKDKDSKRKRAKQPKAFPNPHVEEDIHTRDVDAVRRRPVDAHRTRSLGNLDELALRDAFIPAPSPLDKNRRASIGSPLDLAGMDPPQRPFHARRASDHPVIDSISPAPPLHSIPFPRSSSPFPDEIAENSAMPPTRRYSNTSLGSRYALQIADQSEERPRANSVAPSMQLNDNIFALEPPTNASRFDPKAAAHARTMSNASMGSRFFGAQANDVASIRTAGTLGRERRLSAMELLRPKVLVMPSPLQGTNARVEVETPRDGFQSTSDGPPLPPGARTARRSSTNLALLDPNVPVPSNSFIPNPRLQMSLSQMTFSNNLKVGGEQDVSYSDITPQWPRATEDGEQINIDPPEPEPESADPNMPPPLPLGRPAGKLFGKSLIDDLEERKQQMRSKQRVFYGDQRPSMMARASASSTSLLDPSSIRNRPNPNRSSTYSTMGADRRHSKPFLNFDDDQQPSSFNATPAHTKSVFGVDTLWEREMAKLREMEAAEKIEADQQAQLDAQNQGSRGKNKGKGVASPPPIVTSPPIPSPQEESPVRKLPAQPPTLPAINTIRGPPPKVDNDESESDSDDEAPRAAPVSGGAQWADESDDEKPQVLRTTGVGPRQLAVKKQNDDDSDEDLPLSVSAARALSKSPRLRQDSDSEEEKPLSMLMPKSLLVTNDDDDDAPLGLRASVAFKGPSNLQHGGDDDDKPLAFHPDQQRRSQYQSMLAQQQFQQQQQQMMMQAQFQNSMMFNPSVATMSGFFPPPMAMGGPMMQTMSPMGPIPMPMPSPPPIQDPSKAAWLDQWRRDVAVEGGADSQRS